MGACWAAFLATLARGGHVPSGPPVLPIPKAHYYAWETAFVLPVYLAMFGALASILHLLGRRLGGKGTAGQAMTVAGISMAVPSLGLWLLPDLLIHLTLGFDAMASAMRYYVPLSLTWTIVLATSGMRAIQGLSLGRAIVVALVGLLAHWLIGAPFLR